MDKFIIHLRAAGLSEHTLSLRRAQLARLERSVGSLQGADTASLETYLARKGLSNEYRRSLRAAMRSYYAWLQTTGQREDNPAALLARVKPQQPAPRPVADVDYKRALRDATPDEVLMLRLAAELGLRRGEVAQVHSGDLIPDLLGCGLRVHGKGSKVRVLPLPEHLVVALRRHFAQHGDGFLFPGQVDGHMSAAWIGKRISRLLPEGVTMHALRHRFATRVYIGSGDLLATQQLLGHASPATTQLYVQIDTGRLRRALEAA